MMNICITLPGFIIGQILKGEKRHEWRRNFNPREFHKYDEVYLCIKGTSKIVGAFVAGDITFCPRMTAMRSAYADTFELMLRASRCQNPLNTFEHAVGMTLEKFRQYCAKGPMTEIEILTPRTEVRTLADIGLSRPPQSFAYIQGPTNTSRL